MEPMHPELREALKEAHPGLTDREIDRYEELLAARMRCDPERDAAVCRGRAGGESRAGSTKVAGRSSAGIGDAEEEAVGNGVAPERVLRQNAAPQ